MSEDAVQGNNGNSVDTASVDNAVDSDGGISLTGESSNNPLAGWRDGLSDEIKNDPSLTSFKDVEGLAKSYVHSQKMIGAEKMPTPREDWNDSEWEAFYSKAGRPDTADAYSDPESEADGDGVQLPDDKVKAFKEKFYELGLSEKQAKGLMDYYMEDVSSEYSSMRDNQAKSIEDATSQLREEFGRDFDLNIELARGAVKKFGDEGLVSFLEESGLGNEPSLIKAFASIGRMVSEDDARGGSSSMSLNGSANAQSEIQSLKMDGKFQEMLMSRNATGHKEALERWEMLHRLAYSENT